MNLTAKRAVDIASLFSRLETGTFGQQDTTGDINLVLHSIAKIHRKGGCSTAHYSFTPDISIAPPQVHYHSEVLPTTALILLTTTINKQ